MSEIKHQRSAVANRNMKSISVAGMNGSRASLGRGIRINSAKDLTVYRTAYQLAMEIFELSKHFPAEEKFALTTQIRRSSRSICLNLLEAWAKRRYEAHFVSKLTDCDGENSEIDSSLDFARSCRYISADEHQMLVNKCAEIGRMLNRMMQKSWFIPCPRLKDWQFLCAGP